MTQDEIIRSPLGRDQIIDLAYEAGDWNGQTAEFNDVGLERFAALVAAHEREACAKVCIKEAERHEEMSQYEDTADYAERCLVYGKHIRTCAAAIRSRSNEH